MSNYKDKNELYHWAKGGTAKNHKYISRTMKNGKWQYVYDSKTSGKSPNKGLGDLGDKIKDWWGIDEREKAKKATKRYVTTGINEQKKRKYNTSAGLQVTTKGGVITDVKDILVDRETRKHVDNHDPGKFNRQEVNAKRNAYKRAMADYYKTPHGKVEKALTWLETNKKKASTKLSSLKNSVSQSVKKGLSSASNWLSSKKKTFTKKISELTGSREKADKMTRKGASLALNNYATKLDNHYNRNNVKETGVLNQPSKTKARAYQKARDTYDKTASARITRGLDNASNKIKSTTESVKKGLSSAYNWLSSKKKTEKRVKKRTTYSSRR